MVQFFRVQATHPEDLGKTAVRMKRAKMDELGIKQGAIVKITGGRPAYAFCLPWDDDYDRQDETRFVFLDESSKSVPELKLSDQVYSNVRNFHSGSLVMLEKSSAVRAEKITIRPLYGIDDGEKLHYNLGWLEDQVVVSRGDRIIGRNNGPKNTPGFFVIGGTPDSHAWIVDRETPVEISDNMPEDFSRMITETGNLTRVIPIVQKIKGHDFEATIASIEVYDKCMKILVYVKDAIVHQEEWSGGFCTPAIWAWDDLGNKYLLNRFGSRSGGSQLLDSMWGKKDRLNFSETSCILSPSLDGKAQELTLSVEQLMWDIRKHQPPQKATAVEKRKPVVMTPVSRSEEKFVIHGGPWKFRISLEE